MYRYSFAFMLALLLFTNSSQGQNKNLILNGQFTQSTQSWSCPIANTQLKESDLYKDYHLRDNHIGLHFVELHQQSALEQDVELQKGEHYNLFFALAARPEVGERTIVIKLDNEVVFRKKVRPRHKEGRFEYYQLQFKAKSDLQKLQFFCQSSKEESNKGILITDISCFKETAFDFEEIKEFRI